MSFAFTNLLATGVPPPFHTFFRRKPAKFVETLTISDQEAPSLSEAGPRYRAEIPTSNIQIPVKLQEPRTKTTGAWRLDLVWPLEFGIWMFGFLLSSPPRPLHIVEMKRLFALLALVALGTAFGAGSSGPAASPSAPASFQVRNKKFGQLLRPEDANSANGTRLVLYPAQPWKCMTWKFHPAGESAFQLQNHFTSKTFAGEISAEKPLQAVTQVPFAKENDKRPVWQFTKLPDGTYKIADAKSGKVLTAAEDESGLRIVLDRWHDTEDQKWELLPIDPKQLTM
jgi:hypothetical protein